MGCGASGEQKGQAKGKDAPAAQGVGPGHTGQQAAGQQQQSQPPQRGRGSQVKEKIAKAANEDDFGGEEQDSGKAQGAGQGKRESFVPGFTFGDDSESPTATAPPADSSPTLGARQAVPRRSAVSAEVMEAKERLDWKAPVIPKEPEAEVKLREILSGNALFGNFAQDDFDAVVLAMAEEKFAAETVILEQGGESGKFYVITEGEADILKEGLGIVATKKTGEYFGELELMYPGPNAATVKAKSDLITFTMSRETYQHLVMEASLKRQRIYKDLLHHVSFLKDLDEQGQMTLVDALAPVEYKEGEKIITAGSEPEWMHIIYKGSVSVIGKDEEGKETNVCDFTTGDTVGELEFLHGHVCVADVVAKTDVTTCRLHRDHFEKCMGPLKEFLAERAEGDQYSYYQNARTQFAEGFTFGEEGADGIGGDGTSETEPTPASSAAGEAERPHSAAGRPARREGVSAAQLDDDPDFEPPVIEKSESDRVQLREVLAGFTLLKALRDQDREKLIDAMEECKFPVGEKILEQGESGGQHWYVISKGKVDILRDGTFICHKDVGECFGELELMYDQPTRATVQVSEAIVAWRIDRMTYQHIVMRVASQRREELVLLLKGVDVLKAVDDEDRIVMLADALEEGEFKEGEKLIEHGTTPEWMHIILDGGVEVVGREGGEKKLICEFGRGACVGELEFLNNHNSVADVVAKTTVRTGKLHRSHFERVMGPIADLLQQNAQTETYTYYREALGEFSFGEGGGEDSAFLSKTATSPDLSGSKPPPRASQRQKREAVSAEVYDEEESRNFKPRVIEKSDEEKESIRKQLLQNLLFTALRTEEEPTRVVIDAMERVEYSSGEAVMEQGEEGGEHWYLIEEGQAQVEKNGDVVHICKTGDGFGEMELMYTCKTIATVRAATPKLVCYRLDRATYRHVIMRASQEKRQRYKDALGGVEFLQVLSQWQQDQLADALQPCEFAKGESIVVYGDQHEAMHIIVNGDAEVIGRTAEGEKTEVCKLSRGEMIGELEFLHPGPSVADVVALEDTSTLRLNREHFELCMGPVKEFMEKTALSDKYKYYQSAHKLTTESS
eukprot:Hpha_TRINITY_DN10657_c0_g1::TRINITY_DN10657_c0_g1_i1::g.156706::m.156706/K04739/PRKAR; cAMP-dependent protein kinase regulator